MQGVDFRAYFLAQYPDFFDRAYIQGMPEDAVYEEMALRLRDWSIADTGLAAPAGVTFGWYTGDREKLLRAVNDVDETWTQYFSGHADTAYCATRDGVVLSFCLVGGMGDFQGLRFGGPGCVGTVPACRRQGIGLYMVQNATRILKDQGYDISYIHYTGVAPWYAKLGYQTVLKWNKHGFLP